MNRTDLSMALTTYALAYMQKRGISSGKSRLLILDAGNNFTLRCMHTPELETVIEALISLDFANPLLNELNDDLDYMTKECDDTCESVYRFLSSIGVAHYFQKPETEHDGWGLSEYRADIEKELALYSFDYLCTKFGISRIQAAIAYFDLNGVGSVGNTVSRLHAQGCNEYMAIVSREYNSHLMADHNEELNLMATEYVQNEHTINQHFRILCKTSISNTIGQPGGCLSLLLFVCTSLYIIMS